MALGATACVGFCFGNVRGSEVTQTIVSSGSAEESGEEDVPRGIAGYRGDGCDQSRVVGISECIGQVTKIVEEAAVGEGETALERAEADKEGCVRDA
jgi:hypothetical protein